MKKARVLAVAGVLGAMVAGSGTPAHAGPWTAKIDFVCKVVLGAPGLTYPGVGPAATTTWSINCGKGKPQQHPVVVDETFCLATVTSTDGSKPTIVPTGGPSNCAINTPNPAVNTVTGNCGQSMGVGTITITINGKGLTTADITWLASAGGVLPITGTTRAPKPGTVAGSLIAAPDRVKKGATCADAANPARQFKVYGTAVLVGVK